MFFFLAGVEGSFEGITKKTLVVVLQGLATLLKVPHYRYCSSESCHDESRSYIICRTKECLCITTSNARTLSGSPQQGMLSVFF